MPGYLSEFTFNPEGYCLSFTGCCDKTVFKWNRRQSCLYSRHRRLLLFLATHLE